MIYYTGDIHGVAFKIELFTNKMNLTAADTIVILGDVGANYCGDERDSELKQKLNRLKPTIFCIHGNHEMRPSTIATYKLKKWNGGQVWYEDEYSNLLFAKDGEIYKIEGIRHLVIGGAYSVPNHKVPFHIAVLFELAFQKLVIGIADYILEKILLLDFYGFQLQTLFFEKNKILIDCLNAQIHRFRFEKLQQIALVRQKVFLAYRIVMCLIVINCPQIRCDHVFGKIAFS